MQSCDSALDRYIREIAKYPRLTPEREAELSRIVQGDSHRERIEAAVDELVTGNLLLVVHCAKDFLGYLGSADCRMAVMDLVAEGNIALMRAAETFDAYHGGEAGAPIRFSSYACKVIESRMRRAIKQSRFIHVPEGHFTQWSRLKEIRDAHGDGLCDRALSWELGISMNMVGFVKASMGSGTCSLEDLQTEDDGLHWSERFPGDDGGGVAAAVERADLRAFIAGEMQALPDRTRRMLTMLYLDETDPTLEELSREFGVSRERCRQVCQQGLDQLRRRLSARADRIGVLPLAGARPARHRGVDCDVPDWTPVVQHLPRAPLAAVDAA